MKKGPQFPGEVSGPSIYEEEKISQLYFNCHFH